LKNTKDLKKSAASNFSILKTNINSEINPKAAAGYELRSSSKPDLYLLIQPVQPK